MTEIQYVGENLLPGQIGNFLLVLGFVSSFFSALSYFFSAKQNENATGSWLKLGRFGFVIHGVATLGVIATLFYIMVNHLYEYSYAMEHVSDDLDLKYILSAFWEGQEGSLLLWMFWHIILGFVAIKITHKWEAPVLAIIALLQLVMGTMLLGVHIEIGDFAYRLGSNPTLLFRDTMPNLPLFQNAEYLSLITGNGLNPLLQNIWNTIHPPIIFLGFASLTMPFAYTIAGLWKGKHKECMQEVLKWSLFSAGIMGSGILMGSAWAYVALSFGGYWAWDPVENASFVPWIMLIAGIHTNYIAKSTGRSIRSTYWFYILALVLILYSTFLTRSGVLGDTSAHAFTEMGLEWQLAIMVILFLLIGIVSMVLRAKTIPKEQTEESIYSREFWMFIGALVLFFSSVLITGSTSLPVFNSIASYFDPSFVGTVITDPVPHYNKYQLWIAVFISILSAFSLFMRYKAETTAYFKNIKLWQHLAIATIGGILLTLLYNYFYSSPSYQFSVLMFASGFSVIACIDYLFSTLKGNLKLGAAAISHFGFSTMIIGSLISGVNQHHISTNPFVFENVFTKEDAAKYVSLIKNKPIFMSNYWVEYESDSLTSFTRTYNISFKKNKDDREAAFYVYPNVVYNKDFTKIAALNPSTKMFWNKDIFTDIAALHPSLQDAKFAKEMEDTMKFTTYDLTIGEEVQLKDYSIRLENYSQEPSHPEYIKAKNDLGLDITLTVKEKLTDSVYQYKPALGLDGNLIFSFPIKSNELESVFKIDESFFDQVYTSETNLVYEEFTVEEGEVFFYNGYEMQLVGFEQNIENPQYEREDKDLAVGAILEIRKEGFRRSVTPIYVLRGAQPLSVKEYVKDEGLHIRFAHINPRKGLFKFRIAKDERANEVTIPIRVAENVDRTDYLIFQARVFPGINFFWLGSLTMLFGIFLALYQRNRAQ